MNKIFIFMIAFTFLFVSNSYAKNIIEAGIFSKEKTENKLPQFYEPLTFDKIKNHSDYKLVNIDGKTVIKAVTNQSASGLIRKMAIDLKKYPIIEWSWRIDNIYKNGDVNKKSGDDYPARIYIAFKYDSKKVGFFERVKFNTIKALHGQYPPVASINYIWESKEKVGTLVPNPYTKRVMMFVVNSGEKNIKTWVSHKRNVYKDYIKAFNEEPPLVSGIAIMSDSDNTKEKATAYYGDIIFKKKE